MSHMNLIIRGLSGYAHFQNPPPQKAEILKLNQTSIIIHWKNLITNRALEPLLRSCQGLEMQNYVFNIISKTSFPSKMLAIPSVQFADEDCREAQLYNSHSSTLALGRVIGSVFSTHPSKPLFSLH